MGKDRRYKSFVKQVVAKNSFEKFLPQQQEMDLYLMIKI